MNTPKEVIEISNFLKNCKYEQIIKDGIVQYRSTYLIEKTKKCICFDASVYAYLKLEKLKLDPYILSLRGLIRNNSNEKSMIAHSICIYTYKDKYGAIGKNESDFREPNFTSYEQIALTYADFFYTSYNSWLIDWCYEKISDYKENDYLNSINLIPENEIYKKSSDKKRFEIETIEQYLVNIKHHNENEIKKFLKYIQTGKK